MGGSEYELHLQVTIATSKVLTRSRDGKSGMLSQSHLINAPKK